MATKKKNKNLVFGKGSFTDRGGVLGHTVRGVKAVNDFGWRTIRNTATMPLRGARNVAKLAIGTAKLGGKIGYGITDKAIKGVKGGIKEVNKQAGRSKERRRQEGIGEFATKPGPKTEPKPKSKETKPKTDEKSEKAAWLKKTRNSPAAQSGSFTDDERWALQQKHRKWKADRASGKLKKKKFDPRKGKNQRR